MNIKKRNIKFLLEVMLVLALLLNANLAFGNFYSHELEEYSRFQNKGIPNVSYDNLAYQNTHAASLESYNINELVDKIYPPDVPFPGYAGF